MNYFYFVFVTERARINRSALSRSHDVHTPISSIDSRDIQRCFLYPKRLVAECSSEGIVNLIFRIEIR